MLTASTKSRVRKLASGNPKAVKSFTKAASEGAKRTPCIVVKGCFCCLYCLYFCVIKSHRHIKEAETLQPNEMFWTCTHARTYLCIRRVDKLSNFRVRLTDKATQHGVVAASRTVWSKICSWERGECTPIFWTVVARGKCISLHQIQILHFYWSCKTKESREIIKWKFITSLKHTPFTHLATFLGLLLALTRLQIAVAQERNVRSNRTAAQ